MSKSTSASAKKPALAAATRPSVQRKAAHGAHAISGVPPIVHDVLRSSGQPLDAVTRAYMEPRFGTDFSAVRVHPPATRVIQMKLAINQPGDEYEQEADRVANQVLAAPTHTGISGAPPHIQRFSGSSNGQMDAAPASVDQALASPGRPLEPAIRQDMEQRFGYDFSTVRVHSGAAAEQSARDVNANAYTIGHDIVFGAGLFAPDTHEGQRLIAHELTHVVQQSGADRMSVDQASKNRGLSPSSLAKTPRSTSEASSPSRIPTPSILPSSFGLVAIQVAGGNRAIQRAPRLIQRDRRRSAERVKDAGPSLDAFRAVYPGIIAAMSSEQWKSWHDMLAGWERNRKVDENLAGHERQYRSTAFDPTIPYIASSEYRDEHARIESRRKFVDESKSRVPLPPTAILSPDIGAPQRWNVDAEQRYRTWAIKHFSSKPLEAELTKRREIVGFVEGQNHPELTSGVPHINLLWAGYRIKHTRGIVTWNDLMDIREFSDRYMAEVTNGPQIRALYKGIQEIDSHITHMKIEHESRSDANARNGILSGIVRHISEAVGAPNPIELAILRLKAQQNPNDLDAQAAFAEKDAEAGDYPKMKDNQQGPGIWHDADVQLAAARRFMKQGKFEIAVAALTECEHSTALATTKFAGYERRVMKGAGTAVKWLERAKTAGKIASAFTGTGGVVRAALGGAGYSFAQEGSEQVVAHWIDPSNKIDLKRLVQQAAIDGLATLFGGLTQGAFVNALTAQFGARLVTRYGLSEGAARTFLSAAGATTSSFYNVPAKIVLDKIIAGKELPSSLDDVCNLVTDEAMAAMKSNALHFAVSYGSARGAKTPPAPVTPPPVAPVQPVVAPASITHTPPVAPARPVIAPAPVTPPVALIRPVVAPAPVLRVVPPPAVTRQKALSVPRSRLAKQPENDNSLIPPANENDTDIARARRQKSDAEAKAAEATKAMQVAHPKVATAIGGTTSPTSAPVAVIKGTTGPGSAVTGSVRTVSGTSPSVQGSAVSPAPPVKLTASGTQSGTDTSRKVGVISPVTASPQKPADPLVVVRIQGKQKGVYWEQGTPEFDANAGTAKTAPSKKVVVIPKSQADALGFRPVGSEPDFSIEPRTREGAQIESSGAGRETPHNITARTTRKDTKKKRAGTARDIEATKEDPSAKHAFARTIAADRAQAHGYNQLLDNGELGVLRPGNVSTGGVDDITARIEKGKAKIYLNDYTTPGTSKSGKESHQNWRNELLNAVAGDRLDFGNNRTDAAIRQAIADGEVYIRTVRVDLSPDGGGTVTVDQPTKL